uniref:coiled-coil domain-containing protein 34 isoform X1 n=1 Tax=Jaculus jaculus TaxID=51337 RepID=UPI001E1B328B|nr:coiled-coil domain-containing protein 34 isoform X1 [Jaculus jaculus]
MTTRAQEGADWPGRRAVSAGSSRRPQRRGGLNLAGLMRAVRRWRAPSPAPGGGGGFLAARSTPGSPRSLGSFSGPTAGSRAPEAAATSECPSPPRSLSCSNSTWSLLSPLGHQSFTFDADDSDGDEEGVRVAEAKGASLRGLELQGCASSEVDSDDNQEQRQVPLPESSLTPWEVWFVGKEKEERDRLHQKVLEEINQQLEKRKEMEEREKRKIIAEEKHKEWVQKKNKQERKEREQKINKAMEEKAAKKQEKEYLQEKAKEKYQEWLKKKNAEEYEKKKREKVFL